MNSFDRTLSKASGGIAFREIVFLAIDSFHANKTRFFLTMLGMIVGSASIVLVVTIGLTGKQYVLDTIASLGTNKIEMQYAGGTFMGPGSVATPDFMTESDIRAVKSQVSGITASSPMSEYRTDVAIGGGVTKNAVLLGVSPEYNKIRNMRLLAGRFFDDEDAIAHEKVLVMVLPFAVELYGSPREAIGKTLSISGIPFSVIGVFEESIDTYGQSEVSERTMLTPYQVLRYLTGTTKLKEIFFSVSEQGRVEQAAKEITDVIHKGHDSTSVYKAQTLTDILKATAKIADMLTVVLGLGAAITLIVSGVGIMNSMLASVQARTREIGIRKALGATTREIRLQFLTESVFLSLSGGIIGTLLGVVVPLGLSFFTPFKIYASVWSIVISLSASAFVGILFGTVPADRAAALNPIETLKYE